MELLAHCSLELNALRGAATANGTPSYLPELSIFHSFTATGFSNSFLVSFRARLARHKVTTRT
jgi:hypothetical protein